MISVCIATYNGEKYIKEQLCSILQQLGVEDEIIISDDFSTDKTKEIVLGIDDKRIHFYENHRGKKGLRSINLITTNYENALKKAQGDIIFLADQDDVWLPDKVDISTKYLNTYDYVVSDCYITDKDLNVLCDSRFTYGKFTKSKWKALFLPTPYQGSCAAFKRKVLEKALPFPKGIQSHDRWIGYIASFGFRYKIINEKLIYYRRHDKVTSSQIESKESFRYKVGVRLKYIYELLWRLVFHN